MTIPLEIRRLMGLHLHDKVAFEAEGDVVKIK
jgi:bifunctional DNA-binding transcriptional regulator/antitoxin component of YhaV-PrlF toxin-antitoxin module